MKHSSALWAVAGAAVTAVLLPTAATAVTSQLVSIVDSGNGYRASVDSSHRLRVAETPVSNIVTIYANVYDSCKTVYTVPAGRTLVVKNISMTPNGSSNNSEVSVYPNATCTDPSIAQGLIFDSAGGATDSNIDLGPGAVVKARRVDLDHDEQHLRRRTPVRLPGPVTRSVPR